MNKKILYGYIDKIKKEDIVNFALKEGIMISDHETDLLYSYIKNDYERIISNPLEVINEIKKMINSNLYDKLLDLYDKYKDILKKM